MAFIDDQNDITAGSGKDPIKELDLELESLMQSLNALENADTTDTEGEVTAPSPAEDEIAEETADPATSLPDDAEDEVVDGEDASEPLSEPPHEKKRSKLPLIITLAVIAALLAAGIWFLLQMPLSSVFGGTTETSDGQTVTIHDSEMGTIEITPVQGAPVNTYDESNLVVDENGFYSYYQDGVKISELGVDISEMQGDVDFAAMKACGVDYVILRVGGRYYSEEGGIYEDTGFSAYYDQAKAAGLKVGAYFFSQATNAEEAKEEAEFTLKQINSRSLDYPIAFDWENIDSDAARTDDVYGETLTEMAEAFCDTVNRAGYRSMVYASSFQMFKSYDFETMKDYAFWLADYRDFPNMYYDFTMWQYSKEGTVDGVSGTVDLDICFKPY